MTLTIQEFNKQAKVIESKLVSLLETWSEESDKTKYQVKYADIFRLTNEDGVQKYYFYYSLSQAFEITENIEDYIKDNDLESVDDIDFALINQEFCFDSEDIFFGGFSTTEDGFVYKGIESFDSDTVDLIFINDDSTKEQFIEEWIGKEIVNIDFSGRNEHHSYGFLGEETPVDGVFVGDIFEVVADGQHYDDHVTEGFFNTCTVVKIDGEYLLKSYYNEYDLEEIFAEKEYFETTKNTSFKNFTSVDCCWISDDADLT